MMPSFNKKPALPAAGVGLKKERPSQQTKDEIEKEENYEKATLTSCLFLSCGEIIVRTPVSFTFVVI